MVYSDFEGTYITPKVVCKTEEHAKKLVSIYESNLDTFIGHAIKLHEEYFATNAKINAEILSMSREKYVEKLTDSHKEYHKKIEELEKLYDMEDMGFVSKEQRKRCSFECIPIKYKDN